MLIGSDRPRKYWSDLKAKLIKEGSQLSAKIGQLKMEAEDGKFRITDVADTEQIFRLIQSIFIFCICTEKLILMKQQNTLQIFEYK